MTQAVRVQHLRVRHGPGIAPNMVQSMVEDALRCQIGAVGLAARSGLVVIRRLDLGQIAERQDLPTLKHRVASELRRAMDRAHSVGQLDDPDMTAFDDATVALFPNPLTPHIQVLRAIASGKQIPQSWPSQAVFGSILSGAPSAVALQILGEVAQDDHAPTTLTELISALGPATSGLLVQLPLTAQSAMVEILTRPGTTLVEGIPESTAAPPVSLLDLGLTANATASLPPVILKVILAAHLSRRFNAPPPRGWMDAWAAALTQDAPRRAADLPSPQASLDQTSALAPPDETLPPRHTAGHPPLKERPSRPMEEHVSEVAKSEPQIRPTDTHPTAYDDDTRRTQPDSAPPDEPLANSPSSPKMPPAIKAQPKMRSDDLPVATTKAPQEPSQQADDTTSASRLPAPWTSGQPVATGYAGAVLALSLLHRAFGDWLSEDAHLTAGTGQALLKGLRQRVEMPDSDPMAQIINALPEPLVANPSDPLAFHVPVEMLHSPSSQPLPPTEICRVAGHPSWRMLRMTEHPLPLTVWTGPAPKHVRTLIKACKPRRCANAMPLTHTLQTAACLWAMERFLRDQTGEELASLCRRPGLIVATRTHWDVQFDARLIDLTLRRLGADLSPGWVPWLMRVVTIHYDFGEE